VLRRGRLAAFVVGLALIAVLGSWWIVGVVKKDTDFVVPRGATLTTVARKLEKEQVIGSADALLWRAKLFGSSDPIRAGEFHLPKGASRAKVLDILQHGLPIRRFVTVPEGMPSVMVYERLLAEPLLTGPVAMPLPSKLVACFAPFFFAW